MYSVFCNQPLERVRKFTERDYFFSAAEVDNINPENLDFNSLFWVPESWIFGLLTRLQRVIHPEKVCIYFYELVRVPFYTLILKPKSVW